MKPTKQTEALFQAEEALGTNLQWLTDQFDLQIRQRDTEVVQRLAQLNAAWVSVCKALAENA